MNELTLRLHGRRFHVRPMREDDHDAVIAGFEGLSPIAFRHRFFSAVGRLAPATAADLTDVRDDRLVLLAFDEVGALAGGVRVVPHRDDPATGDVAVTVGACHRRLGLGSRLLRMARREALSLGVDRLVGHVMTDNAAAQAMLVASHAACWLDEPGVLGFEIPLGRRTVRPEIAARRHGLGLAS